MTTFSIYATAVLAAGLAFTTATAVLAKSENPPEVKQCEAGFVLDEETQECVVAESNLLIDDERYNAVREYAYFGDYGHALEILESFEDQDDPRKFNYLGFINRKQGDMDAAMGHYQTALAINPDYLLARSYMGQGMVAMGDDAGAQAQLIEIAQRGGKGTWAYKALKLAIGGTQTSY